MGRTLPRCHRLAAELREVRGRPDRDVSEIAIRHPLECAYCWSWLEARIRDTNPLPSIAAPPAHVTEECARAFTEALLPDEDVAWIMVHAGHCISCRERVGAARVYRKRLTAEFNALVLANGGPVPSTAPPA